MRILHLADVHLDRPFVGLSRDAARRRRVQLFEAFRRALDLARERQANLVTIGGDLWEEEHVRADTRNSVAHELARLEMPVIIACGNHDPLLPGGSYQQTVWPDNVIIAPVGQLTAHPIGDVSVWAVSWGGSRLMSSALTSVKAPADGRPHVMLVHGTAIGSAAVVDQAEQYLLFDPALVQAGGFAVCLAGHIHVPGSYGNVVYPGSPEPLSWSEKGRHCVVVLDVSSQGTSWELVDVARQRYDERDVECAGCASSAEVEHRIAGVLVDSDPDHVLLRLRLVGDVAADCEIDVRQATARYASRYAALQIIDSTEPLLDVAARQARKGLDGVFARKMIERLDTADGARQRRVVELALHAGLRALDGRDEIIRVD